MNLTYVLKNILGILLIITFFNGCSSKTVEKQTSTTQTVQDQDDEFLDEFDDEMETEEQSDPLSGYNRMMTNFNDGLYVHILKPVSNGYKKITTKGVRQSVRNFFHNILYPIRLINNLLQGKVANSLEETGRFVINTTIGLFGLFDPATNYFHLKQHNEDFGQTLGFYGVGAGPHIVLPFFGPSNLRDMVSMVPDSMANPVDYYDDRNYNLVNSTQDTILLKSFKIVNKTADQSELYDKIRQDALDLYIYQKNMYEQYRQKQIEE
jgi:phospholipid-binding lipoprotein MlaA